MVIFTFDGNEIASYIEKDKGYQLIKNISAWLESYDGSLDDLGAALSKLEEYCRREADFFDKWGGIFFIPGGFSESVGIYTYFVKAIALGAVGIIAGVAGIVGGLYCSRREGMWRGQSNILLSYHKKYWTKGSQYPV